MIALPEYAEIKKPYETLNHLLQEKGEGFAYTPALVITPQVKSLEGIEKFKRLKHIKLRARDTDLSHWFVDNKTLQKTLITLSLEGTRTTSRGHIDKLDPVNDLSCFRGYSLETLELGHGLNTKDYWTLFLQNETLKDSLNRLIVVFDHEDEDPTYLRDYRIKDLKIFTTRDGTFLETLFLDNKVLKDSLKELSLDECALLDRISFLRGYELKELSLWRSMHHTDLDELLRDNELLEKNLERLSVNRNPSLTDLSILRRYAFKDLTICSCPNIFGAESLFRDNKRMQKSLMELWITNCRDLRDLSLFEDYVNLEMFRFGEVPIFDLSPLLRYKALETSRLKELDIGDFSNWIGINENPSITNGDVVRRLRKDHEVEVSIDGRFDPPVFERKPKLYIIVGPSGVGKSTVIDKMKDKGAKQFRKITTREYRPGLDTPGVDILRMPLEEFEYKFKSDDIIGVHGYYEHQYGIDATELANAMTTNEDYFLDHGDIKTAMKLRNKHPDFVEIIMLNSEDDLIHYNLSQREESLERRAIYEKDTNIKAALEAQIQATNRRKTGIVSMKKDLLPYAQDVDHYVQGDYAQVREQIERIMAR